MAINKHDLTIISQMVKDLAGRVNKAATIKAALHRVYNLAKGDAALGKLSNEDVSDFFDRMKEVMREKGEM